MKKVIFKYELTNSYNVLKLPLKSKVLCAMNQRETMQLWVEIDLGETKKEARKFLVEGTGHSYDDSGNREYINSLKIQDGTFIFHVFEEK